jgi:MFS family permease
MFAPFFYIVDYAHDLTISPHITIYTLAIMNAGGLLGRIAPAYVSDSIGHFNILTPSAFLCGLSCLVFWLFSKSLVSIMLFAATYGFFSGAFISVITPCVAQISDIREIGTRMGMLYSVISFP